MIDVASFHHIVEEEVGEVVIVCGEGVLVVVSLQCGEYKTCEDVGWLAGVWCTVQKEVIGLLECLERDGSIFLDCEGEV